MVAFVPLSSDQRAYCDSGRAMLRHLLRNADGFEAPELQALFDWCLAQNWEADDSELEQFGPVLALAIGLGDSIARDSGMEWVWVTESDFDWAGPALSLPGTSIICFPMPMVLKRVQNRLEIRIEPLISGTVSNVLALAADPQFRVT